MSDAPQGPGWWQASDGKWYAPEQASGTPQAAGAGAGGPYGTPVGGSAGQPDIGAALSYGWNKFVANIGPIIIIVLIIVGVRIVFSVVGFAVDSFLLSQAVSAVGWVVGMILSLGLVRASLAITRGETPDPAMLFKTDGLVPYILASLLIGIGVVFGLILCIIPGLLVMFFTWFYGFFIVDKGADPIESISASFEMVKSNAGVLLLFLLVWIVITFLTCALAAGVVWIDTAYMYKSILGEPIAP